jgi:hypothetical protein
MLGGLLLLVSGGVALAVYSCCNDSSAATSEDDNQGALVAAANGEEDKGRIPPAPVLERPAADEGVEPAIKAAADQPPVPDRAVAPEPEPAKEAAPTPAPVNQEPPAPEPDVKVRDVPMPPPAVKVALTAEEQKINAAIERGVKYLKTNQLNSGRWDNGPHPVGYAALPGLTLLECGVPAKHPSVQLAAKFVRLNATKLDATYELALAILFLDRLGEPKDKALIQTLAARLIAGQNTTGGWTYRCQLLSPSDHKHLLAFLRRHEKQPFVEPLAAGDANAAMPLAKAPADKMPNPLASGPGAPLKALVPAPPTGDFGSPLQHSKDLQTGNPLQKPPQDPAPDLLQPLDQGGPIPATQPNLADKEKQTNDQTKPANKPKTQVKKAAAAPKAPKVDPLPAHLKSLTVVHMNDGTVNPFLLMGRVNPRGMLRGISGDNSNTQFAMLALWVARRHGVPMERTLSLVDHRFQSSQNEDGGWGYQYDGFLAKTKPSMTCVGLLGLAIGHGFAQEIAAANKNKRDGNNPKQPEQDAAIQRGLKMLGQFVDHPTGKRVGRGPVDLYFLWSVERVGVLYNLKTIGNKDWYGWATEVLLANQNANGSWWTRGYHQSTTTIDTCLALLILKRTNLVQDLTENLRVLAITDPDAARAKGH